MHILSSVLLSPAQSFNRTFMELKLAYTAMRILYKITKYRVGRGGFNRPHNVVNGSLRSLRCYVLLFYLVNAVFSLIVLALG